MRLLTALVTVAALLAAVACQGNSASTAQTTCAGVRRPGVPLVFAPARPPAFAGVRCLGAQYAALIGTLAWRDLPRTIRRSDPNMAAWQERSLLYACDRCGVAGFGLTWVREHHPGWILHSVQGTEIHPDDHPSWVLLNFTDPKYENAWGLHVRKSLAASGWTGVDVIDADNDPDWSDSPVNPATGNLMTEKQRRQKLADALALVRATLKIQGYSLMAENGPPETIDFHQINSTDAVSLRDGFARLTANDWATELRYYQHVAGWEVGTYVQDRPGISRAQMVYGLAGYLLVAIPRDSAYVAPTRPDNPIYAIRPGTPPTTPATADGGAWTRTYPNAVVAVNPSDLPATVAMGSAGQVTIAAHGAAIESGGHLLSTG
jgi:Hypothetical glycosyl hydrolase family 15